MTVTQKWLSFYFILSTVQAKKLNRDPEKTQGLAREVR